MNELSYENRWEVCLVNTQLDKQANKWTDCRMYG